MSTLRNLKENVIEHLKKKGEYDPDVDDYLIDMLIENVEYAKQMKEDLKTNGCVLEMTTGNGFTQKKMNPAFGIYQMAIRNIHQTSAKLGINRADRLKLKLIEETTKDDFDQDFSE